VLYVIVEKEKKRKLLDSGMPRKTKAIFVALILIGAVAGVSAYIFMGSLLFQERVEVEHWTELVEPDRVAILDQLASDFMDKNPNIIVKIVPVPEDEYCEKLAEAKAANKLPDTIRVPLEYVSGWTAEGILNPKPATEVIEELGEDSWGGGVLTLLRSPTGEGYAAVPTDGWVQGVWYRADLFDAAGLEPPTTWDNILKACETLSKPEEGFYGIVLGTDPEAGYTQQNYEQFALSAGARAFDYYTREPTIDTPEQVAALEFYAELAKYTPPLPITWKEANEYYLTGKSAMLIYSTYVIDDILGVDRKEWEPIPMLSKKTGFASTIEGPTGKKATYGMVYSFGITVTADQKAAKTWIKYILDERLYDYVSISIVGMMPARTTILEQWKDHEYFKEYAPGLAEQISSGFNYVERWGYQQGKSFPLISEIYGEVIIPKAIGNIIDGVMTPSEAAKWAQEQIKTLA